MRPTTPKTRAEFVGGTCRVIIQHLVDDDSYPRDPVAADRITEKAEALGVDEVTVLLWDFDIANAFVLGTPTHCYVVVSTALVDLLTEDELVAVITHEIAHSSENHTLRLSAELALYLSLAALVHRKTSGPVLTGSVLLAGGLFVLKHVREAEKEADSAASSALDDSSALVSGVEKVRAAGRDEPPDRSLVDDLIATHPSIEDRF